MTQMVVSVERRSWVQSITGELIAKDGNSEENE